MTAYNKLFAAIISTILMRLALRYTGLDLAGIGVGGDVQDLVALGVDALAAGVSGFFVWLIPNVQKRLG